METRENLTRFVKSLDMRAALVGLIETAEPPILRSLGLLMLDRRWTIDELERDLGSQAIEALLHETEHLDYFKLQEIHAHIQEQR